MKRILLLSDFSDTARNAAMYALKMMENEAKFFLLNAYDLEFSGSPYIMQVKEELAAESLKGLKNELALIRRRYPDAKVELLSLFGSLLEVLKNEVNKNHYDLIVLGCRGESALENFLLGSRAYEVIKNIEAPILLIPKHAKFKKPEKVIFATDLKDFESDEMVEPVRDIVEMFHAPLLFVNVLEEEYVNRIDAEEKIASHFPGINVSFNFIEDDDVIEGINKFMDDKQADMIALVRHNVGIIDRLFHPSITKQMVLHPEHPMLILHEHEHDH
ncbi:MAG: universal stress protein [Marinilabiliaceae bacterium]|nr:universal stress protein [Marinilabiliaceae bacterium]